MRRRNYDHRFELVAPAAHAVAAARRAPLEGTPLFVPVRVVASTAPVARQVDLEQGRSVDVAFPDGTQLHFAAGVSAAFVVEVVAALRSATC